METPTWQPPPCEQLRLLNIPVLPLITSRNSSACANTSLGTSPRSLINSTTDSRVPSRTALRRLAARTPSWNFKTSPLDLTLVYTNDSWRKSKKPRPRRNPRDLVTSLPNQPQWRGPRLSPQHHRVLSPHPHVLQAPPPVSPPSLPTEQSPWNLIPTEGGA